MTTSPRLRTRTERLLRVVRTHEREREQREESEERTPLAERPEDREQDGAKEEIL